MITDIAVIAGTLGCAAPITVEVSARAALTPRARVAGRRLGVTQSGDVPREPFVDRGGGKDRPQRVPVDIGSA